MAFLIAITAALVNQSIILYAWYTAAFPEAPPRWKTTLYFNNLGEAVIEGILMHLVFAGLVVLGLWKLKGLKRRRNGSE